MASSSHTVKTVALFTVYLLLSALVVFTVPRIARTSFVPLAAVMPLVALLIIHRRSLGLQTIKVLAWAVLTVVCFSFASQVITSIQYITTPAFLPVAGWSGNRVGQPTPP